MVYSEDKRGNCIPCGFCVSGSASHLLQNNVKTLPFCARKGSVSHYQRVAGSSGKNKRLLSLRGSQMGFFGIKADVPQVVKNVAILTGIGILAGSVFVRTVTSMNANMIPEMLEKPPIADKIAHAVPFGYVEGENRGPNPMNPAIVRNDDYFWLRDDKRENPKVINHLKKENAYTNYSLKHLEDVRKELYDEMLSHVQETDTSVPYKHGNFWYYTRSVQGLSYDIHGRIPIDDASSDAVPKLSSNPDQIPEGEQITLDENELAKGLAHCDVRSIKPSPDHSLIAYSMDSKGYETYQIFIKDLSTGELLPDVIPASAGSIEWGADKSEIFYAKQDEAHRTYQVWRHVLGTDVESDECLITEPDERFSVAFYTTLSRKLLLIGSQSSETSEWYYLKLGDESKSNDLTLIAAREFGVEYDVDEWNGELVIVTNCDKAVNFKIVHCPIDKCGREHWKDLMPYDPTTKIDAVSTFKSFLTIHGRRGGFKQLWMRSAETGIVHQIDFEEEAHTVSASTNKEYDTKVFRFTYSSMTTPRQTFDYDVESKSRTLLKEAPVPKFDRTLYESKREYALASDGTRIPMSIVYRKDRFVKGTPSPCFLYGYGSYEIPIDPGFNAMYLPILDRGVTVVIAHVRGGGEEGRTWYDPGARYLTKKNTFTDFISCAEHLIAEKVTVAEKIAIEGRSAGGLLMGAVVNMRPDLFKAVIAGVPFVDVMNTMSDASIPLTTGEWEEWGNPNEEKYYEYMLSYSPYDNVVAQDYPSMLVTSGLWDPRVAYWEPAKWVAKLRDLKTDNNPILLKIDLEVGHFSASDRYRYIRERAYDLAFMFDQLGVSSPSE